MNFLNEQIRPGSIPDIQVVDWQPIEKDYLKVLRLQWLIVSVILLFVAVVFFFFILQLKQRVPLILIVTGWVIIIGCYFFLQEKSFHRMAYVIREHDILYRKGWIVRRIIACPFNRVQHCSADAGPLDRKYRLSSITLFTAGATGADLRISGLKEDLAQQLREFILEKIKTNE